MADVPWSRSSRRRAGPALEDHSVDRARTDRAMQHVPTLRCLRRDPSCAAAGGSRAHRTRRASAIIDGDLAVNLAFNRYVCTEVSATPRSAHCAAGLDAGFEVPAIRAHATVYDDFEYCDKVAGCAQHQTAIKAGYLDRRGRTLARGAAERPVLR